MISIVCPVYNEEKYISQLLDFYKNALPVEKELFLIDGGSKDNTRSIILEFAKTNPSVYLLYNPKKYVPFALNAAIPKCKGDYIIRLDAHTHYAIDYFEKILAAFSSSSAEIVGGPMRAVGVSEFQKAVAYATSTTFGVGNSQFHFKDYKGFTDSVYLGAWKKEIFDTLGYFDERMVRNQDDEFHYRARSAGHKIFQDPQIISYYYPRDSVRALFNQYYQYGLYKPLVLRKVKSEIKLRHLIPSSFVVYFALLPVFLFFVPATSILTMLYVALLVLYSFRNELMLKSKLACILIYPTLHAAYGLGFIKGLISPPK